MPATTRPVGPVDFQPGVQIDWQKRSLRVTARVVLREGPLEFLACFAGKDHESILRIEARATHIFMAMGLIGLTPGRPPQWDERQQRYLPPEGDLVDVSVTWFDADGRLQQAAAHAWLTEVEFSRPALPRPWVFGGSRMLPDGILLADRSGAGIALVDMPDSLLSSSRSRASRDGDLWVMARTEAIPPPDTPVTLLIGAANKVKRHWRIDFRGATLVDDRFVAVADFIDLLSIQLRQYPAENIRIEVAGTLESDLAALRRALAAAEIPAEQLTFDRP